MKKIFKKVGGKPPATPKAENKTFSKAEASGKLNSCALPKFSFRFLRRKAFHKFKDL